ncbi:MAG: cyclic nucleotide-binding domain-containing protein [Rhodospirillales bacterium]|nr:cyclic nucleotide-binding domain-containing protein [Rhodospirillales bacterium]
MDYKEAVSVLRGIPVFASLDTASLKLLAFSSSYLSLDDGEALCHQGDPGDSVFLVDEGEVEVSIVVGDTGRIRLATLGRHDIFGEMAVICNQPRTADVHARGPLKVLKIEADVFLQLITANPDAALGMMRVLAERLMRFTERYEQLKRERPNSTGM